ncbi:hypothetical protein D1872_54610 [compost metagenome]
MEIPATLRKYSMQLSRFSYTGIDFFLKLGINDFYRWIEAAELVMDEQQAAEEAARKNRNK